MALLATSLSSSYLTLTSTLSKARSRTSLDKPDKLVLFLAKLIKALFIIQLSNIKRWWGHRHRKWAWMIPFGQLDLRRPIIFSRGGFISWEIPILRMLLCTCSLNCSKFYDNLLSLSTVHFSTPSYGMTNIPFQFEACLCNSLLYIYWFQS